MTRHRVALVLLWVALGCEREPEVDLCEQTLASLRERLETAAAQAAPPGAPDWMALPEGEGVAVDGAGPLLVVSATDIELDGRGVGGEDIDEAAEVLARDLESWARASRLAEGADIDVRLWAAPDTQIERLVQLLGVAPPEARFSLLVRGEHADGEAPDWVREAFALDAIGRPRVRRQRAERAWRRATRQCEAARGHLPLGGDLQALGPAAGRPSVEPLMRALAECGCEDTGLPTVELVATRALLPLQGPIARAGATLRFGASPDGQGERSFSAEQTVQDLTEALGGQTGVVWVRVP